MPDTGDVRQRDTGQAMIETTILDNTGNLSGVQRIVLDTTSYNFGKIKPRRRNIAVFRFRNAGSQPLKIADISKCCRAIVKSDKKELAPGQSGAVTVEYRAGQKPAPATRSTRLRASFAQG